MGHDINICALYDENIITHNQMKFAKIYNTKIETGNNKLGWN